MKFLAGSIGELVIEELEKAVEAQIAVAFFNPTEKMITKLLRLPKLELIISEEFTVNNPYKIERLKNAVLRSIPIDSEDGKLHAKVIITKRKDGSYWVLLGSANFTKRGMFENQEACVAFESGCTADVNQIHEIQCWFDRIFDQGNRQLNLEQAKLIFDCGKKLPASHKSKLSKSRFWALKTKSGINGPSHWLTFLAEQIIAIGWEDISIDPSIVDKAELQQIIQGLYLKADKHAAATIKKFIGLKEGDLVLICDGYIGPQKKQVYVYGIAKVTGPFFVEPIIPQGDGKWRFKHKVEIIQKIETKLPKDELARILGKGSLRKTLHELKEANFEELINLCKQQ